jgi:hypothetical protein
VGSTIGKLLKKETGWVIRYPYREMVHKGTKGVMGSAVYIMISKEINLNQSSLDLLTNRTKELLLDLRLKTI